jgi:hypothetical protein
LLYTGHADAVGLRAADATICADDLGSALVWICEGLLAEVCFDDCGDAGGVLDAVELPAADATVQAGDLFCAVLWVCRDLLAEVCFIDCGDAVGVLASEVVVVSAKEFWRSAADARDLSDRLFPDRAGILGTRVKLAVLEKLPVVVTVEELLITRKARLVGSSTKVASALAPSSDVRARLSAGRCSSTRVAPAPASTKVASTPAPCSEVRPRFSADGLISTVLDRRRLASLAAVSVVSCTASREGSRGEVKKVSMETLEVV